MESSQYFSLLVLAVCAFHLVSVAWNSLANWWGSQEKKQGVGKGATLSKLQDKAAIQQRSDWYAFFHCSDLTGESTEPYRQSHRLSDQAISDENSSLQKNRPQDTTKRPRASMNFS